MAHYSENAITLDSTDKLFIRAKVRQWMTLKVVNTVNFIEMANMKRSKMRSHLIILKNPR